MIRLWKIFQRLAPKTFDLSCSLLELGPSRLIILEASCLPVRGRIKVLSPPKFTCCVLTSPQYLRLSACLGTESLQRSSSYNKVTDLTCRMTGVFRKGGLWRRRRWEESGRERPPRGRDRGRGHALPSQPSEGARPAQTLTSSRQNGEMTHFHCFHLAMKKPYPCQGMRTHQSHGSGGG